MKEMLTHAWGRLVHALTWSFFYIGIEDSKYRKKRRQAYIAEVTFMERQHSRWVREQTVTPLKIKP